MDGLKEEEAVMMVVVKGGNIEVDLKQVDIGKVVVGDYILDILIEAVAAGDEVEGL